MKLSRNVARVAMAVVAAGILAAGPPAQAQTGECSAKERAILVEGIQRLIELVGAGDTQGIVALDRELTAKLSPACIAAIAAAQGRQETPEQACTAGEREMVTTCVQRAVVALASLDMDGYMEALKPLNALSPRCQTAVAAAAQANQGQTQLRTPQRIGGGTVSGGVMDHGGGAYSIPGQVYCSPTGGCTAL